MDKTDITSTELFVMVGVVGGTLLWAVLLDVSINMPARQSSVVRGDSLKLAVSAFSFGLFVREYSANISTGNCTLLLMRTSRREEGEVPKLALRASVSWERRVFVVSALVVMLRRVQRLLSLIVSMLQLVGIIWGSRWVEDCWEGSGEGSGEREGGVEIYKTANSA